MANSIHFSIKYDGPALQSHQMDIRELTPALIALSNMLEENPPSSKMIINGASAMVEVHFLAKFQIQVLLKK